VLAAKGVSTKLFYRNLNVTEHEAVSVSLVIKFKQLNFGQN